MSVIGGFFIGSDLRALLTAQQPWVCGAGVEGDPRRGEPEADLAARAGVYAE